MGPQRRFLEPVRITGNMGSSFGEAMAFLRVQGEIRARNHGLGKQVSRREILTLIIVPESGAFYRKGEGKLKGINTKSS